MKNAEPQHLNQDDRGGIDTGVHPKHSNRQGLKFTQETANPALAAASQTYIATGANVRDEFVKTNSRTSRTASTTSPPDSSQPHS